MTFRSGAVSPILGGVEPDEPVRVGGQALPDGVLMRTSRAWAIARRDGSVASGTLPGSRFESIPVVRVLSGLGPALALGLAGGRRSDSSGRAQRRRPPWPLIRGLVLAEGAVLAVSWAAGGVHVSSQLSPVVSVGLLVLALVVFRVTTPACQWRYHGAEHKAVTAHELGIDTGATDQVLGCSRIHPRCGTNLIVWMAMAALWLGRLPLVVQLPAVIASLAVLAEIVSWAGRHSTSILARVILAPGRFLQRLVTTSEPTPAEQQVACRALASCLALDAQLRRPVAPTRVRGSDAPYQIDDKQDDEYDDECADSDVHASLPTRTGSSAIVIGNVVRVVQGQTCR